MADQSSLPSPISKSSSIPSNSVSTTKILQLYAYVILDNHMHTVVSARDLASVLKSFKMFTAREILKTLQQEKKTMAVESARLL